MRARAEALDRIAGQEFDVCVIGGGATGAGCALDAQLRGLRTVLLDASDFASGASSASTKLAHGGIRYLEQAARRLDAGEYRLVRRALHERMHILRCAPHLARVVEFLVPVFTRRQALYYGMGAKFYDWVAREDRLFASRFLSREQALARLPALDSRRLRGAVAYSDGQFDDARYVIALLQSFAAAGGEALNYARVASFDNSPGGRLGAADVEVLEPRRKRTVRARVFVNAAGAASDSIRQMAAPGTANRLRPSKGVHILFPLGTFLDKDALLVPKTEDGRVVFAIPWLGRLLVGTTDDEVSPDAEISVRRDEADYLLRQLNPYLAKPLRREQIVSAMAGLRPLVTAQRARPTKELIRDHEVEIDPSSGLISILGGKWTTYRLMAEDTINTVQHALGVPLTPCATYNRPLAGAAGFSETFSQELVAQFGISQATARHLASKFGAAAKGVLALCRADPALALPLVEDLPPIRAEAVYAIRQEMAVTLEDVLARRIGVQHYDWRKSIAAAPLTASLLARELGWTDAQTTQAVANYTARIRGFLAALGLASEEPRAADIEGPIVREKNEAR